MTTRTLLKLSILIILSCISPTVLAEEIKSASSDFSILISKKTAVIVSPEKVTLPIFFSPEGNPAVSIPVNFPYRVLVAQNPNQDVVTSISLMNSQMRLLDLITIDRSRKVVFAEKSVIEEMRELAAKQE